MSIVESTTHWGAGPRARAVRFMAWFLLPWSLVVGVGMCWLGESGAAVATLGVALGCVGVLLLIRSGWPRAAGHLLVVSLMQCMATISVLLGGVGSPPTQWWVLAPVMATAALGVRAGIGWAAAMSVWSLVLLGIQMSGGVEGPFIDEAGWAYMGAGTSIGLLVLMSGFLWANDVQYRRLMARLRAAQEAEREASRAKSQFLANMSHELRTPLNAILGYSELVGEEVAEEGLEEAAEDLRKVRQAGRHLLSLVNDVLDLSKVEAGRMEMRLEPVDVEELIAGVADQARPLVAARGNQLVLDVSTHRVQADGRRLRQCLLNLVSNAAKFTEAGTVSLRVHEGRFEVEDTGIGMDADQVAKVFEPFVQADASVQQDYGGTGLGLAIVKQMVEQMGGSVGMESAVGKGTTVWLQLPLVRVTRTP